ncbi:5E5 antigen-like [Neofelis nebulosa]|uniref:5E5 antigen-like n=1 Tax=Neofelis nebulosa TaxID=61452 RepID=UPI0027296320|nr:5E5 antigen-like [Neofelis nebulosa]
MVWDLRRRGSGGSGRQGGAEDAGEGGEGGEAAGGRGAEEAGRGRVAGAEEAWRGWASGKEEERRGRVAGAEKAGRGGRRGGARARPEAAGKVCAPARAQRLSQPVRGHATGTRRQRGGRTSAGGTPGRSATTPPPIPAPGLPRCPGPGRWERRRGRRDAGGPSALPRRRRLLSMPWPGSRPGPPPKPEPGLFLWKWTCPGRPLVAPGAEPR